MGLRWWKQVDVGAAVIAGLAAGATYVATMEIDNRLTGINEDDLTLLGRPIAADPSLAKLAGVPVHFGNSVALALVYAAVAHDRLPGPPWLRGALFATLEDTLLYPIAKLEQLAPRHPRRPDRPLLDPAGLPALDPAPPHLRRRPRLPLQPPSPIIMALVAGPFEVRATDL